ncbi:hypothetical protein HN031_06030 [Nocardioides sp. zg-1308]|uniref:DUF4367 domain-containing protein n=1 Tax=Nocardioides renjunii TaxID=3095075 RepID=A0ABU5K837_9ACTN|nr:MULTISPECIES: hypothetical protein [unclassified Nocardioides]MDZ5661125.1 hypothetical protein [Nocardioides sp. S-58]NPD04242.1 hypothetical protein [Nocardioides sp. zg-1308]
MNWRGPAVLVALLAIGAGSGFAASAQTRDATLGEGVPSPVPASRPDMPVEAPRPYETDPDDPALLPGIAMKPATLGSGKFEITFPAPVGWTTNANASNEWKWKKPGTSNNTYVMRIEQINSQDITIEDAIDIRIERLRDEQEDVVIIERGADTLEYTYRSNEGNARHSFMRWLDLDMSGQADVEIVVHGREVDVEGAEDLIRRVGDGMGGAGATEIPLP